MMIELSINRKHYLIDEVIKINGQVYEYSDHLGRGGNSSVECFIDQSSGIEYAIKVIPLEQYNEFVRKESKRSIIELKLLKELSHEHIINYYGYARIKIQKYFKKNKENLEALVIVMEKADCSLKEYICDNKVDYSEYSAQLVGLSKALDHLHSLAIHRDLKPENILVINSKWVISDFGLAKMNDGSNEEITSSSKAIGPKYWLSPEAFSRYINIEEHRKEIVFNSDIFQMCAIFWFIINRNHPSGVLSESDFQGPEKLFSPIIKGLQHDTARRYESTSEFAHIIEKTVLDL